MDPDISGVLLNKLLFCLYVANYDCCIGYGIIFPHCIEMKLILQLSRRRFKMKGDQKLDHPLHHQLHSWH